MLSGIFNFFDKDQDGLLNRSEMQHFLRVINNTTHTITLQDWLKICQYWVCGVVPVTGWCCALICFVDEACSLCRTLLSDFLACTSVPFDDNYEPSHSLYVCLTC